MGKPGSPGPPVRMILHGSEWTASLSLPISLRAGAVLIRRLEWPSTKDMG